MRFLGIVAVILLVLGMATPAAATLPSAGGDRPS